MKEFYATRHGLLQQKLNLSLLELREAFYQVFSYFYRNGTFNVAFYGYYSEDYYTQEKTQILPPRMAPSPEVFFMTHLQDKRVWPIGEYYDSYSEEILFSVIEILYEYIGKYNDSLEQFESDTEKAEYAEQINNLLKAYGDGFYLETTDGFVMQMPNQALQEQLEYSGEDLPPTVLEQLVSATKMFYRFDADMETKKKAINILADILEKVRNSLKETFNQEYNISKNEHDKLIFEIVNGYNIRHNNATQKTDYSREIWYDWMMQYYTSTIIAYYKLEKAHHLLSF